MNSYLDIFIGEYSIETVLGELARCLNLLPNLHTVQIDVASSSRRRRSLGEIFQQSFKEYSYPQIRNIFVMFLSVSFVASCPQARRVGFTRYFYMSRKCLQIIQVNCPHLEELEGFGDVFWTPDACNRVYLCLFHSRHCIEVLTNSHSQVVVNNFPNLRSIQFMIFPSNSGGNPSHVCFILLCEDPADSLVL